RMSTSETSLQQALVTSLRTLGKPLAAEALWRVGFPPEKPVVDFSAEELGALLDQVDTVYSEAATSNRFRLYHTEKDVIFSLIQLEHLEASGEVEQVEEFDDLSRAIRICRSSWFRKKEFSRLHGMLKGGFEREERKTLRSLEHAEDSIAHIGRATEWEGVGNLLLANFYQLKRGDKEVLLTDWEGNQRSIKLDPKLTPAENADRYFRKARGARKEAEHSGKRAEELRARRDALRDGRSKVDAANEIEELEKIRTEFGALIGMKVREKEERREERFRRFIVEGGFEVFAGKSAANNDELTLRFARPNDIWLHARGSSGSHVVLRWNEADGRPPKRTLEEAAMIAAFYSGAKHSKLVPVAWTRKKYVRKPKGAAPGAVLVNREEVVMVEPRLPENRGDSTSES
ncbi:MAG: NFACT RNA binding domain-containing protein, partial [Candidatus Kapaibacterium sp.]